MSSNQQSLGNIESFLFSLKGLSEAEITKSKELYIRNKLVDYKVALDYINNPPLWHYFPPFFVFILIAKTSRRNLIGEKGKLINTLEVWKEELSYCYLELNDQITNLGT